MDFGVQIPSDLVSWHGSWFSTPEKNATKTTRSGTPGGNTSPNPKSTMLGNVNRASAHHQQQQRRARYHQQRTAGAPIAETAHSRRNQNLRVSATETRSIGAKNVNFGASAQVSPRSNLTPQLRPVMPMKTAQTNQSPGSSSGLVSSVGYHSSTSPSALYADGYALFTETSKWIESWWGTGYEDSRDEGGSVASAPIRTDREDGRQVFSARERRLAQRFSHGREGNDSSREEASADEAAHLFAIGDSKAGMLSITQSIQEVIPLDHLGSFASSGSSDSNDGISSTAGADCGAYSTVGDDPSIFSHAASLVSNDETASTSGLSLTSIGTSVSNLASGWSIEEGKRVLFKTLGADDDTVTSDGSVHSNDDVSAISIHSAPPAVGHLSSRAVDIDSDTRSVSDVPQPIPSSVTASSDMESVVQDRRGQLKRKLKRLKQTAAAVRVGVSRNSSSAEAVGKSQPQQKSPREQQHAGVASKGRHFLPALSGQQHERRMPQQQEREPHGVPRSPPRETWALREGSVSPIARHRMAGAEVSNPPRSPPPRSTTGTASPPKAPKKRNKAFEKEKREIVKDLQPTIASYGENHVNVAGILVRLADVYSKHGQYERALKLYQVAVSVYCVKVGEYDERSIESNIAMGRVQMMRGEFDDATEAMYRALWKRQAMLGNRHPSVSDVRMHLADLHKERKCPSDAVKETKMALRGYREAYGDDHPTITTAVEKIAALYTEMGVHEKAHDILAEIVKVRLATNGRHHPFFTDALLRWAQSLQAIGDVTKALKVMKQAYALCVEREGDDGAGADHALSCIGDAYAETGQHDKAVKAYTRVLNMKKRRLGEKDACVAGAYLILGKACREVGRHDKAMKCMNRAMSVYAAHNEDNTHIAHMMDVLHEIGITYRLMGEHAHALKAFNREYSIRKRVLGSDGDHARPLAVALHCVGVSHFAMTNYMPALRCLVEALNLYDKAEGRQVAFADAMTSASEVLNMLGQTDRSKTVVGEAYVIYRASGLDETHPALSRLSQTLTLQHRQKLAKNLPKDLNGEIESRLLHCSLLDHKESFQF